MFRMRIVLPLLAAVLTTAAMTPAIAAPDEPPVFSSPNSTAFVVGAHSGFTISTTPGNPPATVLSEAGTLPTGITFTDNGDGTASLAGTPAAGTGKKYPLTLTATAGSATVSQAFTLNIDEAPSFTSADRLSIRTGVVTRFTVSTAGGYPRPPAITLDGDLPSGLDFADNGEGTATLSGTTSDFGEFPLTLTAGNGLGQQASQAFMLQVQGPPTITSAARTSFTADQAGSFTVTTAPGLPTPTTLAANGALPAGITFTDKGNGTGVLSGTAFDTGSFPLLITAENGVAPGALQQFTLTVSAAIAVPLPRSRPAVDGVLLGLPRHTRSGQLVRLTGTGFAPGSTVTIGSFLPRALLSHVTADASGAIMASARIRSGTGEYLLLAAGRTPAGAVRYLDAATLISNGASSPSPTPSTTPTPSRAPASTSNPAPAGSQAVSAALANTGPALNPLPLLGIAALLGLAGLVLTRAARRHQH